MAGGSPKSFVAVYEGAIIAALLARATSQVPRHPQPPRPLRRQRAAGCADRLLSGSLRMDTQQMQMHDCFVPGHGQPGQLALVLAAVEGGLEEAPEVAECLLAFLFHYMLADDRVTSLAQGAAGS